MNVPTTRPDAIEKISSAVFAKLSLFALIVFASVLTSGCSPERLKPEDLKRRDRSEIIVQNSPTRTPAAQPPAAPATGTQESGAAPGGEPMSKADEFRDAALNGDLAKAKSLAADGVEINSADPQGRTALQLAAFDGHTETVTWLIENSAQINHLDESGRSALMYASTGPNLETVNGLLAAGAEVNLADKVENFTALMFAAAEGQQEVVERLLESDADPSLKDADGESAMDFAKANGHTSVLEILNNSIPKDDSP